ncbi:MAG: Zn-dependent exopeptidase M28 [bacterium]|nr:Zn-dependent exopeptidase M28 [bacterium]
MRIALVLVLSLVPFAPAWGEPAGPSECAVLDIHRIGATRLAALTTSPGLDLWLELDDELFVCASVSSLAALEEHAPVRRSLGALNSDRLRLAYRLSRAQLEARGLRVLAAGGLFAVVETQGRFTASGEEAADLLPFRSPLILARQVANQPARARVEAGEGTVARLVAAVEPARWFADVESLAAYNRFTGGSEIHDAHDWLMRAFRSLPGVTAESDSFRVEGVQVANVIATLSGRSRPDDWFIVGGHYDSISEAPLVAAPGAEDNASGCAGVLEMARIFSAHPPEATMLFICYAGEEQGLFGSADHVEGLLAAGEAEKVGAMLNLDMIGFTADADLDCLLQSDPGGQFLIDALADSAARHTRLRLVTSNVIGGSDHVPYAVFGIPAVLSIEADTGLYPHYHRMTDTPDHLTPEMAAEILRMNVGALARFTGNSDVAGCLKLEDEPLVGLSVSSRQSGAPRLKTSSDRQGCFAVDPMVRGKSFKLRIKGNEQAGDDPTVSGCVRLLGEPAERRRVIFRQSGEPAQKTRSDSDGCYSFQAAGDKRFTVIFKGPEVPADG